MIKKILMVLALVGIAATAQANGSYFGLDGRLEQTFTKLPIEKITPEKAYETSVVGTVVGWYRIRPTVYAIGRVSYPFVSKAPQYAVGVEVKLFNWSVK